MAVMKKFIYTIIVLLLQSYILCHGQQVIKDRSKSKYIIYGKEKEQEVAEGLPELGISDITFIDVNSNSVLEEGEKGKIKLLVRNTGSACAEQVFVSVSAADAEIHGVKIDGKFLVGELLPDISKEITIPVKGESDLVNKNLKIKLSAKDKNGHESIPADLVLKVRSHKMPELKVSSAIFGDDAGEVFQQNFPIKLSIRIKNSGIADAEKVSVKFSLPGDNCVMLGETDTYFIDRLEPDATQEFLYIFTATSRYTANTIPVKIHLSEVFQEFGQDTILIADLTPKSPDLIKPSDEGLDLKGKYYALIMGVNEYDDEHVTDLDQPLRDAQKVYDIITRYYTFEKGNVTFLKNPTRADIISALDELERTISANDNFFIFFAGHGYWDERSDKGYWLPSDASRSNTVNWIRNTSVSEYMASIKSRHTLLVADACFSGGIFKTRRAFSMPNIAIQRLYDLPSRKAMTSGTLKEVPDKSVFVEYLAKRLEENLKKYLPSEQLFFSFKPAVLNNSDNVPQFGIIKNAGDEGGDFIFIRR